MELQALMARASQSAGGAVAGAMAYRTEYIQAQGQLKELKDVQRMPNSAHQAVSLRAIERYIDA